ncbi:MAG: response regulator [Planctomycetota bacterium]|nr:MAG: response regulator [Planctomycetota bacterium]
MDSTVQFLAEFLAGSTVAALVVDSGGVVAAANRAAESLFGFEPGQFEGERLAQRCALESDSEHADRPCRCTPKNGRPFLARVARVSIGAGGDGLYIFRGGSSGYLPALDGKFQAAILAIARTPEMASGDFLAASKHIVRLVAEVMGVERVSLWLLTDEGATLECITLYELGARAHSDGVRLHAKDYPRYFEALDAGRALAADDAVQDPRTREFATGYLDVLGITSMLDSVMRVSGRMIGVVCHEHVGAPRRWRDDEIVFAAEVADQAATAYLAAKHREAESARTKLEDELLQAHKLEAIGRLAGGVAHDFNNLLSVILGNAELLEDPDASPEDRASLAEILSAAERAADLTNQLLAIGRRQILQTRRVDLNELVGNVLKLLRRVIPADVELAFEPMADPATVRADAGQLEQAVMNLCLNARDATAGGGRIELSLRHDRGVGDDGGSIVLGVQDDGVGIPADVQERIFEPFFTTKDVGHGTGLGLSMVHGIAHQHGGEITVRSHPGEGTLFELRLPYAGDVGGEHEASESSAPNSEQVERSGRHVIVADDSESIRRLVQRVLVSAGYRVTLARDGEDAVRLHDIMADETDLVILDVVMPKQNGRDAFEAIKRRSPDVGILFMTGYGIEALAPDFLEEHGVDVVHKPWTSEVFLAAVGRAIGARNSG